MQRSGLLSLWFKGEMSSSKSSHGRRSWPAWSQELRAPATSVLGRSMDENFQREAWLSHLRLNGDRRVAESFDCQKSICFLRCTDLELHCENGTMILIMKNLI